MARSIQSVLSDLSALGVNLPEAFLAGRLTVQDWYSATLTAGRLGNAGPNENPFELIEGGVRMRSLKVSDLSLEWLRWMKTEIDEQDTHEQTHMGAESLLFAESCSSQLRFNEERSFVEWMESRVNPNERRAKRITFQGFARGLHSDWVYRRMEADWDGLIDIRVIDHEGKAKSFLRIRSLRGQPHDSAWHEVEIRSNGEAFLKI